MTREADYAILDADGNETVIVSVSAIQTDATAEELVGQVTDAIESAVADEQVVRR